MLDYKALRAFELRVGNGPVNLDITSDMDRVIV